MNIHLTIRNAATDMMWYLGGSVESPPFFRIPSGTWDRQVNVDPYPCYGHDPELVKQEAERNIAAFPIDRDVTYGLIDREEVGRTNGITWIGFNDGDADAVGEKPWTPTVVLFGKRIPIHPAMTRYLVAHEYGHVVSKFLRWKNGEKDADSKLYSEYQKLRGFKTAPHYGGGTWHATVEEIFANDFRILVVGAEREFWPHPGFSRPEGIPEIIAFWQEKKKLAGT
jgi:hypothetical protein